MRMLPVVIRVTDLDRSIDFYANVLGIKILRKKALQTRKFTLAFLGYADELNLTVLELIYNWDTKEYAL